MADSEPPQGKQLSAQQLATQKEQAKSSEAARPVVRTILILVMLGLVVGGLYYYWSTKDLESTDDAYTAGTAIDIAPQVTGTVVSLDVADNQFVHRGQPLIHIDPRNYEAALEQAQGQLEAANGQLTGAQFALAVAKATFPAKLKAAQAQLADAQASLEKARADDRRQHNLPRAATTGQQIDYADAALHSAEAQVASAEAAVTQATPVPASVGQIRADANQLDGVRRQADAALRLAQINLDETIVRAPVDGWITKRNVDRGNYLQPGQQIFSIVAPTIWVTANFKENQLDRLRPGQSVDIAVDAYPSLKLKGHVDSVQMGSGNVFTAFPPENATGNFVKIVQRVPVKIDIDSGLDPSLPLPLGLSVTPTVSLK